MLWKFNRFMPEKPCQTGTLVKRLLLMLIDIRFPAICVILPPAPSVLQEGSSEACVDTRGSVRRASGFVLTGIPEVMPPEQTCNDAGPKSSSGKLNLVASTISKTFLRRDCARFFSPHCAAGTLRRSHRDLFATGRGGDPSARRSVAGPTILLRRLWQSTLCLGPRSQ
jgi:hypothetical protein